ncbi:MAG: S8 family serine peptidase [bacterium]
MKFRFLWAVVFLIAIVLASCNKQESPLAPGQETQGQQKLTGAALAKAVEQTEGKVIIGFHSMPRAADLRMIEQRGGKITHRFKIIEAIAARVNPELLARLEAAPQVTFVEPDYPRYADLVPNDPQFGSLWGLNNTGQTGGTADADIDAPEAWNVTTGSPSVLVSVIDTGTDINHEDLAANIWVNPGEIPNDGIDNDGNGFIDDVNGWDFFNNDNTVFDDPFNDDHGTHVSGTIAAVGNNGVGVTGVNWQATVMPLKFLGPNGGSTADAILAIQYATDKGARVMNASWGGGGFSQALKNAIDASGAVFCAAAGNSGLNNDIFPHYPSSYTSANLIAVAATDHNDQVAGFSNFGATSVDLAAPGVSILSTTPNNTYSFFNGTSMATPHVSGVAALVLSQSPGLSATQVRSQILNGVDPVGALNDITFTGGRLNAANALGGIGPQAPVANAGPDQNVTDSDGNGSEAVTLDGSASFDPDGTIVSYQWTEGATVLGNTAVITSSFAVGTHNVTLAVTDNDGLTGSDNVVVAVNAAPSTDPPSNLTADADRDEIDLRWTASATPNVRYNVYRSTTSGGPYSLVDSGIKKTKYTDKNLQVGVTFYYVVTAVDGQGVESAFSNEASATTFAK